jgi:hypothetical protein
MSSSRADPLESYRANFAFDFAATLSKVRAPTVVLEIVGGPETQGVRGQGPLLAADPIAHVLMSWKTSQRWKMDICVARRLRCCLLPLPELIERPP